MDYFKPGNIEFLDLTGVDEEERNRVLLSLYSWDPNVKLPWKYNNVTQYSQQSHHSSDSLLKQKSENRSNCNTLVTSVNENPCIQQYPVYLQGYHVPSGYPAYSDQKINSPLFVVPNYQTPPVVFCDNYSGPVENHLQHAHTQNVASTFVRVINDSSNSPETFVTKQSSNKKALKNHENNSSVPNNIEKRHVMKQSNQTLVVPKQLLNGVTNVETQLCELNDECFVNKNSLPSAISSNSCEDVSLSETIHTVQNNSESSQNENIPNKSWASLFSKPKSVSESLQVVENGCSKSSVKCSSFIQNIVSNATNNANVFSPIKEPFKSDFDDPNYYRMGEFLFAHNVDNRIISLQPRGLINRSNYCYINSILQALLACPPVYNLLCNLSQNVSTDRKKVTPIIDGMSRFVKQFHHLPAGMRVGRRMEKNQKKEMNANINCDTPFEPAWIYKILSGIRSDTFVVEGRQEDAEEFLGCLLNGLNDEMLELIKLITNTSTLSKSVTEDGQESNEIYKEWQVMGPKNKGSVTRRTEFGRTPISDIFGGLLRSRIHRTGDLSTDNIQPFFTLQLNIEKATTVQEALEFLVSKNQLEGVTSSKTNQEVEAWQQVTIEELPIVLVLHLKCFDYKLDGCTKIIKALEFPIDLKIDPKLLSSKTNSSAKEKQYKLFAVVYHDGKEASKGHYITDGYHVGYASWLRYDDASVKVVQEEQVLKPQGTRVPYLLFYRRSDSIRSK